MKFCPRDDESQSGAEKEKPPCTHLEVITCWDQKEGSQVQVLPFGTSLSIQQKTQGWGTLTPYKVLLSHWLQSALKLIKELHCSEQKRKNPPPHRAETSNICAAQHTLSRVAAPVGCALQVLHVGVCSKPGCSPTAEEERYKRWIVGSLTRWTQSHHAWQALTSCQVFPTPTS